MQIRGVELDFRLYDEDKADVKNRYFEELKKMGEIKKEMPSGTEAEKNRYLCSRIKGMFDNVFDTLIPFYLIFFMVFSPKYSEKQLNCTTYFDLPDFLAPFWHRRILKPILFCRY